MLFQAYVMQGFFLAVFWATLVSGVSDFLSFWQISGLSFGKSLSFQKNFGFFG